MVLFGIVILNILFLLYISFVPLPTSLVGRYIPDHHLWHQIK